MPFWIFHRGWGLLGVPVAAAGPGLAFLAMVFVRPPDAWMPIVLAAGVFASSLALIALDRRLARGTQTDMIDADSGVRQRVTAARDSVMFLPLAGWGWIGFVLAGLLFLVGS